MNPNFDSIAVANHPGVSPTGLRIAVNMLLGKKVDESKLGGANGLSFVLPLAAVITKENLDEGLAMCEGKPDAYLLDKILTDEEVQQYFVQEATNQPFTIGISNPFSSSEYRTQMIAELIEVNKEYTDKGITTELVIESADTDVAGQIQQLQNLIAKDVDAILVNPGDVNGLNATLLEALNKGNMENKTVADLLHKNGKKVLPITFVNGSVLKTGEYPSYEELCAALGIEPLKFKPIPLTIK